MSIPTRKQLNRLAAHNLLEDRNYTRKEATKIITAVIASGAKPQWKLAENAYCDRINKILLRMAKKRLTQLEAIFDEDDDSDANMKIDAEMSECDEIITDAEFERESFKEIQQERIRDYQDELNPAGWESSDMGFSPWEDQIKKPKIAQVKASVEILDITYPDWEEMWGTQMLINTLLHNYPDLKNDAPRIKEFQELIGPNGMDKYRHLIKRPTQKQLRDCLEALDEQYPEWETKEGIDRLVVTLLQNFPDLLRR